MLMKVSIFGVVLILFIAGIAYQLFSPDATSKSAGESVQASPIQAEQTNVGEVAESPFAISNAPDNGASPPLVNRNQVSSSKQLSTPQQQNSTPVPAWDALLSEAELATLVKRLKSDPALLQRLMDEFRQESDPAKKAVLAGVLGEVGGEQVTLLASELIFSGNESERALGLDLLQDVQPGNMQARDIVSGMLATEVEPSVLIDTMTVLARPGDVDEASRAYLSDQIAWLSTHDDVSVRGISLDILSRWSNDGRYTDVYLNALDDEAVNVRSSAAYALVGHGFNSAAAIDRLFNTLGDTAEFTSVKRAAALALNSLPLSPAQQAQLQILEKALNTATR